MQKVSYAILLAAFAFTACNDEVEFKKGTNGLEYKILTNGRGDKIKTGNYMQIQVSQYYATGKKDSLLSDTRTQGGPLMEKMDSSTIPPAYYEILSQLRKDDSLIMRITTDSAYAKSPQGLPPIFKKGHFLTTRVKVMNIFTTREASDSARIAERKLAGIRDSLQEIQTLASDDKKIQEYLTKHNIKTVKSPLGTYVEMIQPGTGNIIDTSVVVSVNYTGRTLDGHMFDSNTDPSKGHNEPLIVNLTSDRTLGMTVIKGWNDGLKLLNKGAKARFYIPSSLGYGPRAQSEDLPANAILVFDIEILDILSKDQARVIMKEKQETYRSKQKAYMDSVGKVNENLKRETKKKVDSVTKLKQQH